MKPRVFERLAIPCLGACWILLTGVLAARVVAAEPPPAPPSPGKAAPGQGQSGKSGAAAGKAGPEKGAKPTGQGLGSFGKLLPMGQKNRDVKIPSFRNGSPSSFLRAATMTRRDDENMDMERLEIRMFGETEEKDLRMTMPTATYHMPTEVLVSEERSRIARKDFDLQGDTLVFDTRSQQGKMTGHIHMIIFDADSFFRQKPAPASAPAAAGTETGSPATKPTPEKK